MSAMNVDVIEEFRANNGVVGGFFAGKSVLILHTTGARSGLERLTPLLYRREGDRIFVFASNGGADTHPAWYYNLKSTPAVAVEVGAGTVEGTAAEIVGEEREAIYTRQGSDLSFFADYQAGTDRTIPVVELVLE